MKPVRKKRRSLVRILASCVPNFVWKYLLSVSPRMVIVANDKVGPDTALRENNLELDYSNSRFYSFKSHVPKSKELLTVHQTQSEQDENSKIKKLQNELDEIKKQIAKLMEHQSKQSNNVLSQDHSISQSSFPPVPPPPPPPPPPLPTFSLTSYSTPFKKAPSQKFPAPPNMFPFGKELLKNLQKVQLKKVEKSPGGGPIKKAKKSPADTGEFLEAILRRRFGFAQNSPDSSLESGLDDNSFTSGSHSNSFEMQKEFLSVVS